MPTLLKIDVSPRGGHSVSRALGTTFAKQWSQLHSDGKVLERDLAKTELPFVELPWITAAHSDSASRLRSGQRHTVGIIFHDAN
jgi:FMN-dependent NADH-azoreductase